MSKIEKLTHPKIVSAMEKTKQKDRGEGRKCQEEEPVADSGRWSVLVTFMYRDMRR